MEDFAKIQPISQEYAVTIGDMRYAVPNPVKSLDHYRKKLAAEGDEPQESTMDIVEQLERIVKSMPKKTHTTKAPTPAVANDGNTIHINFLPIGLCLLLVFVIVSVISNTKAKSAGTKQTTTNPQLKPLRPVKTRAAAITMGEMANTVEPGRKIHNLSQFN